MKSGVFQICVLLALAVPPAQAGVFEMLSQGMYYLTGGESCGSVSKEDAVTAVRAAAACLSENKNGTTDQAIQLSAIEKRIHDDHEDGFFSVLATQHSKELSCSADFAKRVAENSEDLAPTIARRFKDLMIVKHRLRELDQKLNQEPNLGALFCHPSFEKAEDIEASRANDPYQKRKKKAYEICGEIVKTRAALKTAESAIPLMGVPEIAAFAHSLYGDQEVADIDKFLEDKAKSLYAGAVPLLQGESKKLAKRANETTHVVCGGRGSAAECKTKDGGNKFDPAEKQALLSDPAVVKEISGVVGSDFKNLACEMDSKYGSGAKALDTTLMVGSLLATGGTALAARGTVLSAKFIAGTHTARTVGFSMNSVRTLQFAALGVDGVTAFRQIDSKCSPTKTLSLAKGDCVSAPNVESVKDDECVATAALAMLGIAGAAKVMAPQTSKMEAYLAALKSGDDKALIKASADLSDPERVALASKVIGRKLTDKEGEAVIAAHNYGKADAEGNFDQQTRFIKALKAKRGSDGGFSDDEVRKLGDARILGTAPQSAGDSMAEVVAKMKLKPSLASQTSFRNDYATGRIAKGDLRGQVIDIVDWTGEAQASFKILRQLSDGSLEVMGADGTVRRLKSNMLAAQYASASNRAKFERELAASNDQLKPRMREFREDYAKGKLKPEASDDPHTYLSFRDPKEDNDMIARVKSIEPNGDVVVVDLDGKRRALTPQEFHTARYSSPESVSDYYAYSLEHDPSKFYTSEVGSFKVRSMTTPKGREPVRYATGNKHSRKFAEEQKYIQETTYGERAKLEPGTYTFGLLHDGTLVTGRVTDKIEYGVKHMDLANGRRFPLAGELKVLPDGTYQWNLQSGNFSREIIEKMGVPQKELELRAKYILENYFGRPGKNVKEGLLPNQDPSLGRMRTLCANRAFAVINEEVCCNSVGMLCH